MHPVIQVPVVESQQDRILGKTPDSRHVIINIGPKHAGKPVSLQPRDLGLKAGYQLRYVAPGPGMILPARAVEHQRSNNDRVPF